MNTQSIIEWWQDEKPRNFREAVGMVAGLIVLVLIVAAVLFIAWVLIYGAFGGFGVADDGTVWAHLCRVGLGLVGIVGLVWAMVWGLDL